MGFVLSIDQGTTNTKALLVGRDGRPVFRAAATVSLEHPRAGFAEQDPEAIWQSVVEVVRECVAFADRSGSIAGIAIANQRETALAWERGTGRAIASAMSWQCRRSVAVCERMAGQAARVKELSGLPLDPLLSATKWAWLLQDQPGLRERVEAGEICFGTVDSWLIWKLTGGAMHACDATNASRTGLLNLRAAAWDEELMGMFGVAVCALPEVKASSGLFGDCVVEGLAGVPLVAVIGDSHGALVGHGLASAGTVKATYGTGSSLMTVTDGVAETAGLANTIAWATKAGVQYALEGNISMAGAGVQWVGEFLGLARPVEDAVTLAATVRDASGVVFVPGMAGLGAPHWRPAARGVIAGLEAGSKAAHLARAAVEAIAFQVCDVFAAMEEGAEVELPALQADGGATRNDELMQLQADLLGRPVLRSACEELSALGAAWLGGLELGWWTSMSEFASLPQEPARFVPGMPEDERRRRLGAWHTVVERALLEAR